MQIENILFSNQADNYVRYKFHIKVLSRIQSLKVLCILTSIYIIHLYRKQENIINIEKTSGIIVSILAKKRDIKRLNSFIGYREKCVGSNLF